MTPNAPRPQATGIATNLKPVLIYFVFASLWILLSDKGVGWLFSDPTAMVFANSLKGWLFVAVTSGLLFFLLQAKDRLNTGADLLPSNLEAAPKIMPLRVIFLALALVPPLIGFAFFKVQTPQVESEATTNLQAIAQFKAQQVEDWLVDRDRSAAALTTSIDLAAAVHTLVLGKTDAKVKQVLQNRFEALQLGDNYVSVVLFDRQGKVLLSVGEHLLVPPATRDLMAQALDSREVQRSPLFRTTEGHIHLDWLVPLVVPGGQGDATTAIAVVLLRTEAKQFLFAPIETWPVASASAESLLVRRDGEKVVFLNDLRHRPGTAFGQPLDVTNLSMPAVKAALTNAPGTMQGVDYRGVAVLAAYRPIVGTDWHLVAKVDRGEVMAPLWRSLYWVSLMALAAVAAIMLALWQLWRQQRRAQQLELVAEKGRADKLLQNFFDLPFVGMAITSAQTNHWVRFNDHLCEILGYSRDEMAAIKWAALTHQEDLTADLNLIEQVMRGETQGFTIERRLIRKDGGIVHAVIDVKCVRLPSGVVDYFVATVQDISERKTAEASLHEAENRYRTLADSGQALIWTAGIDKLCNDFNSVWLAFTGRTLAQEVGHGWLEGVHPEDFQRCLDTYVTAFDRRERFSMDYRLRHHDGSYHWLQDDGCPRYDSAGEFIGYIGYCLDITDRVNAVNRLVESEARFSAIIETSPVPMALHDEQQQVILLNPAFVQTFGYDLADIPTLAQWWSKAYPDPLYRQRAAEVWQAGLDVARQTGEPFKALEVKVRCKDGSPRVVVASAGAISGKFSGHHLVMLYDITDRKAVEDQLNKLSLAVEQSPESIVITDMDAHIDYVNEAFVRATGYTREEVIGKNPRMLHSGRTPPEIYEAMWETLT